MCFIVFAYRSHPRYHLVLASNRDEFYERPTAPADFWEEAPDVLAGRDLKGGGTWFGVTRQGRFAALTNVREPGKHRPDAPTRGALVADFLTGTASPSAYLHAVRDSAHRYNGFNLIVGDTRHLCYFGNRDGDVRTLSPGLYGLSNRTLDTPWPKIERGKAALADVLESDVIAPEALFSFLDDRTQAPDENLPDTGVGLEWERLLSPIFIQSPSYGTRASTLLLMTAEGHVTFVERTFEKNATVKPTETRHFTLSIEAP